MKTAPRKKPSVSPGKTVALVREADLRLLLSDKEGGFAVMPKAAYEQKAKEAILKNFRLLQGVKPKRVKK